MPANKPKLTRAESARINGAKSKGPKTPGGLFRSQTATYKYGLYAVRNHLWPIEWEEELAEMRIQLHACWQAKGFYDEDLVEELVHILWEIKRTQASKSSYLHDLLATLTKNSPPGADQAKLNLQAEAQASVAGGTMSRSNARLARLGRERRRIAGELLSIRS
jgi:hypothetical protein